MMAVAERRDFRDAISIVETSAWRPLRRFDVATQDLADVSWSPDGKVICVIDTLLQYQAGARAAHASRLLSPRCAHQRPRALPARGTPLLPLPPDRKPE